MRAITQQAAKQKPAYRIGATKANIQPQK